MLAFLVGFLLFQAPSPQVSLADLLKRIPQVTVSRDRGISDEQEILAKQLQAFEARAIPELLPLLDDSDEIVRGFVGYVLRDIRGVEEKHLDELIRACRSGNGWIAPAIAHIGTPKAIAFLIADLQAHPEIHTQVTWALSSTGEPAALALAASFRSDTRLDAEYAGCASFVFKEMHEHAAAALNPLLEVARGKQFPLTNRKLAIEAIGALDLQARDAIPELKQLAASESGAFTDSVEQAIISLPWARTGSRRAPRC
ncbi:MAG: hypothetical protein IPJ19_06460 [Planctomycetes bacterium]|nr:hypothetical protein [Planctomycetota bacterium]